MSGMLKARYTCLRMREARRGGRLPALARDTSARAAGAGGVRLSARWIAARRIPDDQERRTEWRRDDVAALTATASEADALTQGWQAANVAMSDRAPWRRSPGMTDGNCEVLDDWLTG